MIMTKKSLIRLGSADGLTLSRLNTFLKKFKDELIEKELITSSLNIIEDKADELIEFYKANRTTNESNGSLNAFITKNNFSKYKQYITTIVDNNFYELVELGVIEDDIRKIDIKDEDKLFNYIKTKLEKKNV